MAPPTEERRSDTVAIPRAAVKFIAGLASSLVFGISIVLWNVVIDHVRLDGRVNKLEDFGPKTGERFTKRDAIDMQADIDKIEQWLLELQKSVNTHHAKGEHAFAGRRLNRLESWANAHDEDHHE